MSVLYAAVIIAAVIIGWAMIVEAFHARRRADRRRWS